MRFPMGLETVVEDGRPFVALRAGDPALNKWASPLPLRARPLARCRVLVQMQRLGLAKVEALVEEQAKAQDAEDGAGQAIEDEKDETLRRCWGWLSRLPRKPPPSGHGERQG